MLQLASQTVVMRFFEHDMLTIIWHSTSKGQCDGQSRMHRNSTKNQSQAFAARITNNSFTDRVVSTKPNAGLDIVLTHQSSLNCTRRRSLPAYISFSSLALI
jgi:hypothetical protein